MSQCVPSWDLDDSRTPPKIHLQTHSNSLAPNVPSFDYEVAELTWKNGQLAMHGLGPPKVPNKPIPNYGDTLESIVNQATRCIPHHHCKSAPDGHGGDEVVPWFNSHHTVVADTPPVTGSVTMAMDALVPNSKNTPNFNHNQPTSSKHVPGVDGSAHVGSCSGTANSSNWMTVPRVCMEPTHEWSSRGPDISVSGSATCSRQLTIDAFDRELGGTTGMFTSTSMGSPENTSSGKQFTNRTEDDHDSVCHSRPQREAGDDEDDNKKGSKSSSASTKRKRAAAIHNQSERKRRDKINQRMKTLQKLVPNSSKTDKASMLDEVIEYLRQLQAQVNMMSRMNMSPAMMLPLAMQQQLQMSMIGMGMGMGMGMGVSGVMDINNTLSRPNIWHPAAAAPAAFMQPINSSTDCLTAAANVIPADPLAALLACQSQPMTMDAYSRMAALYQQFQQPAASSVPKN